MSPYSVLVHRFILNEDSFFKSPAKLGAVGQEVLICPAGNGAFKEAIEDVVLHFAKKTAVPAGVFSGLAGTIVAPVGLGWCLTVTTISSN